MEKKAFIEKAIVAEEEQFLRTLERGLALMDEEIQKLGGKKVIPGEVAFKLYDTYGFPLDLTRVIGAEKGLSIDEIGFEKAMDRQKSESRKHWKGSGQEAVNDIYMKLSAELKAAGKLPKFLGYEQLSVESECVAFMESPTDPKLVEAVFRETPFYGESGGQVGDRGRVTGQGFEGEVVDVQRPIPELIVALIKPIKGILKKGTTYRQETDQELRALTARNHTATHLLHWALREVLGTHVKQAGSLVAPDLLRFDFSHFQAMTEAELIKIENLINEKIWSAQAVSKKEMEKEKAIAAGAIAMFGEKYGDRVRVVQVGSFSVELCGGTHVDNSSDIHLFKIGSEGGIAAGVRRMIAYTSKGAFDYLRTKEQDLKNLRDKLKVTSTDEIASRIDKLLGSEKDLKKQLEQLQAKNASGEVDEILKSAADVGGAKIIAAVCAPSTDGIKRLRDMADRLKQKAPNGILVLVSRDPQEEKVALLILVGPNAPKKISANDLMKELAPMVSAKGGGKPDLAQAGGTQPAGMQDLVAKARSWIPSLL
jgi:alanyl-tRNA synthetase